MTAEPATAGNPPRMAAYQGKFSPTLIRRSKFKSSSFKEFF